MTTPAEKASKPDPNLQPPAKPKTNCSCCWKGRKATHTRGPTRYEISVSKAQVKDVAEVSKSSNGEEKKK